MIHASHLMRSIVRDYTRRVRASLGDAADLVLDSWIPSRPQSRMTWAPRGSGYYSNVVTFRTSPVRE